MIEKRRLGNTDLSVGVVTMGCGPLGSKAMTQSESDAIVGRALDEGINLVDTAEKYNAGGSEIALGRALKGRRQDALILTKLYPGDGAASFIPRFEASLKRLNTDYVDIFMPHWPSRDEAQTQALLRACQDILASGKARMLGVSNFGFEQLKMARSMGIQPIANELPYNLISRAIERDILPLCIHANVGVLTYSTQQQGVLTGKYEHADQLPAGVGKTRHFSVARGQGVSNHDEAGADKEIFEFLSQMREVARELGVSMAGLSLAWNLSQPGVASAIVGMRTMEHLESTVLAAQYAMPTEIRERLATLSQPVLEKLGSSADYFVSTKDGRIH